MTDPNAPAYPSEVRELIAEMADDLRCYIAAEYPPETRHFKSNLRRYNGCMEIVNRADALLAELARTGNA